MAISQLIAITVFSQKMPQGLEKNWVRLRSNRKATERVKNEVITVFCSFGVLSTFWCLSIGAYFDKVFFGVSALPFSCCLKHSFYYEIDTPLILQFPYYTMTLFSPVNIDHIFNQILTVFQIFLTCFIFVNIFVIFSMFSC